MASYFDHFLLINIFYGMSDSLLMLISMLTLTLMLNQKFLLVNNSKNLLIEELINHWVQLMNQNLNKINLKFIYPFFSLFTFLMFINLFGFWLFTFPMTTHLNMTLTLAFMVWFYMFIMGVYIYKSEFFSMFMPSGSPLALSPLLVIMEMVSYMSSPVALGMSLAANLTAGHILLAILSDFSCKLIFLNFNLLVIFPISIMMFMTMLELGVLFMQAYVFVLLTVVYLSDSLILH